MDTLIPGIVLQWPCISNRRWMRLWGPTWWITVCFTALLSPSSIWACKKMAWDSPWGYRPCGCSATWIQLVTVACANNKQHAYIHPSIHPSIHMEPRTHSHMHAHIHTHMYIGQIYVWTYACALKHACTRVRAHTHMRAHTCTCSCMSRTYIHTNIYIYIYIHTYIIQCSHLCVQSTLCVFKSVWCTAYFHMHTDISGF